VNGSLNIIIIIIIIIIIRFVIKYMQRIFSYVPETNNVYTAHNVARDELSYLAPLGSENISAPYFKKCFFQEGGVFPTPTPPTESNTTLSSPKTEITNILFYILNLWRRTYCSGLRGCDTREKEIVI